MRKCFKRTGGACGSAEEAAELERVTVTGLAGACSDALSMLEGLDLCCAACGPHFLGLVLAPKSPSLALLDELMNGEATRARAWAVWCQVRERRRRDGLAL